MSTCKFIRSGEPLAWPSWSKKNFQASLVSFSLLFSGASAALANSDVQVNGEMRRMFQAHDIGPNVDLAKINLNSNLYALGPLAGLQGEITIVDSKIFVSTVEREKPVVRLAPDAKAIFLVHA